MSEFKLYQSKERWEIRSYVVGEDVSDILFDRMKFLVPTLEGGYIIRKPDRPIERWYITREEFEQKFEVVP